MKKKKIGSRTAVADEAKTAVHVSCEGEQSEEIARLIARYLQKENRRRRHRGDLPIAYDILVG